MCVLLTLVVACGSINLKNYHGLLAKDGVVAHMRNILETRWGFATHTLKHARSVVSAMQQFTMTLRTKWTLFAILCRLDGDPHSRYERILVSTSTLATSLACSILFYVSDDDGDCGESDDQSVVDCMQLGVVLWTILITAPLDQMTQGSFEWLHKPQVPSPDCSCRACLAIEQY